jgi:hypothetical protein
MFTVLEELAAEKNIPKSRIAEHLISGHEEFISEFERLTEEGRFS